MSSPLTRPTHMRALKALLALTLSAPTSVALAGPMPDNKPATTPLAEPVLTLGSTALKSPYGAAAVAFSPDGWLVTAGGEVGGPYDPTVRMWDPETGAEVRRFEGAGWVLEALAVSADGQTLVAGGRDGVVYVWRVEDGRRLASHALGAGRAKDVAVVRVASSPRGDVIAAQRADGVVFVAREGRVDKAPGATGALVAVDAGAPVMAPDDALGASWDGRAAIFEVRPGSLELRARDAPSWRLSAPGAGEAKAAAVSPDRNGAAMTDGARLVYWRSARGKAGRSVEVPVELRERLRPSLAWSEDGRYLALAGGAPLLVDTRSGRVAHERIGHIGRVTDVAVGGSGGLIASVGRDRQLLIWDRTTGALLSRMRTGVRPRRVAFVGSERVLVQDRRSLTIFEAGSGRKVRRIRPGRSSRGDRVGMTALAVAPDGVRVAVGVEEPAGLALFDLSQPGATRHVPAPDKTSRDTWIHSLSWSADGSRLAFAVGQTHEIHVLDAATLETLEVVRASGWGGVNRIALSEKGAQLLVGGAFSFGARVVTLGKAGSRSLVHTRAHVSEALFVPGAGRWLTGDERGRVRLWPLDARRPERAFRAHDGRASALAVGPDGTWLVSGGSDGQLRVWTLP